MLKERRGSEFFAKIGQQGGEKTKATLGREHYARIGRLGGQHRAKNAAARKTK
jgi:general stress protein YciG